MYEDVKAELCDFIQSLDLAKVLEINITPFSIAVTRKTGPDTSETVTRLTVDGARHYRSQP